MPNNIEKLKALSLELEETESAFSAFWYLAPHLFIITNREGFIHKINNASKRVLGYEPDELVGKRGRDFIHPDDVDSATMARAAAFKDGNILDFKCRWKKKDGSYIKLSWNSSLVFSDKYIYAIGVEVING